LTAFWGANRVMKALRSIRLTPCNPSSAAPALCCCLVISAAAGCLWRGYATIMNVHLDVLTQTADKLCAVVESRRPLSAEGMAEYVYPAQRGREFLRQFGSYRARPSYRHFGELLDRYEALVRTVDALRAQGRDWQPELPRLTAERDAIRRLAEQIRGELKTETG